MISLLIDRFETVNYGDVLQDFACEYLFESMGIPKEEIVHIPYDMACAYDGETLVVPIYNAMLDGYFQPYHVFSPKIIPCFLGLCTDLQVLPAEMVSYLRSYEPIGCRDEYTVKLMRRYGIRAYIGGCITPILPKRNEAKNQTKVFFTDIPEALKPHIPKELLQCGEFISQEGVFPFLDEENAELRKRRISDTAAAFYQRYRDEAALVVTSRLHSTLPCLAMGIPVILVRDEMWKTFSFVDAFTPIYLNGNYENIEWNPQPVDYEHLKARLRDLFATRLTQTFEQNQSMVEIGDFYESRKRTPSNLDYYARLDELMHILDENVKPDFTYIIWGAGVRGAMAFERVKDSYPNSKLIGFADARKTGVFHEQSIIPVGDITKHPDAYVIVCNNYGEAQALSLMRELNRLEKRDFWSTNLKGEL
jgi:hypothetical protein